MRIRQTLRVRLSGPLPRTLCVATPAYGDAVSLKYFDSMLRLQRVCGRAGIRLQTLSVGHLVVDQARDSLAATFLAAKKNAGDVLVFVDGDQGFNARTVFDAAIRAESLDVVGVSVPLKAYEWKLARRVARRIGEDEASEVLPRIACTGANFVPLKSAGPLSLTEPVEVSAVGTGILAVHRRVLARMAAAHPELKYDGRSTVGNGCKEQFALFQPMVCDGHRLSEDYAFCHRWRALGGKCWALLYHVVEHVGSHVYVDDLPLRAALGVAANVIED